MTASVPTTTCTKCRAPVSETKKNGNPYLRCARCRTREAATTAAFEHGPVYGRPCDWCGEEIDPNKRAGAKCCSIECRSAKSINARRVPCQGGCGRLVRSRKFSPESKCRTCMAIARGCLTPGVRTRGGGKCQCEGCYLAKRDARHAGNLKYRELHGESYSTTWWRINRPDQFNLPPAHRLRLFERDGWLCAICHEPTSLTFSYTDPLSPTLDHIEPQSAVLIPDHSDTNLRLTHAICNKIRSNRMEPDTVIAERVRRRRQYQETYSLSSLTLIGK